MCNLLKNLGDSMFLKYAYRPVLTTDTRKNQYARAFYQVYSGVLAKDIKSHFLNNKLFHIHMD